MTTPINRKSDAQHGRRNGPTVTLLPGQQKRINLTTFDPSKYLAFQQSTPGMTNRTLEERFPNNPFPGNNVSTGFEVGAADPTNRQTILITGAKWMQFGLFAGFLLSLYLIYH